MCVVQAYWGEIGGKFLPSGTGARRAATYEIKDAPLKRACRTQVFPPADFPVAAPLRERLCGATRGEHLSNRVSANAVGRRGRFPQGRGPPRYYNAALEGNAPSWSNRQPFDQRWPQSAPEGRGWGTGGGAEQGPHRRTAADGSGRGRGQGQFQWTASGSVGRYSIRDSQQRQPPFFIPGLRGRFAPRLGAFSGGATFQDSGDNHPS